MTDQRSKRDHRSKRDPQEGDTWCWGDNVSRNARGIKFKIIRVEEGFGGGGRVHYTGPTAGAISVDSLKWSADFMMEGPPPPKPVPSQAAIRDAAYLNGMASDWMRGVKADWARADREEHARLIMEAHFEEERLQRAQRKAKFYSELPVDEHRALCKRKADFRRMLETFFKTHLPNKLPRLNTYMEKFETDEERMVLELAKHEAKMAAKHEAKMASDAALGAALLTMPDAQLGSLLKPIKST